MPSSFPQILRTLQLNDAAADAFQTAFFAKGLSTYQDLIAPLLQTHFIHFFNGGHGFWR